MTTQEEKVNVTWKDYHIGVDELQFVLYETKISKKRATGEEYEKDHIVGFYTKLEHLLQQIVRIETTKHGSTFELREYLSLWGDISREMNKDLAEELSVLSV